MNEFTIKYIKHALFSDGEIELEASRDYNDIDLDWGNTENLNIHRQYEPNIGWAWDGKVSAKGVTWGGCVESLDELLRHGVAIPTLDQFENIILLTETSEEIPTAAYVCRVFRALGERGILKRIKGLLVGRPKAWEFSKQNSFEQKTEYRKQQREMILEVVRKYNSTIPIVQNLDFGHTDPQIPMPYGSKVRIETGSRKIFANF